MAMCVGLVGSQWSVLVKEKAYRKPKGGVRCLSSCPASPVCPFCKYSFQFYIYFFFVYLCYQSRVIQINCLMHLLKHMGFKE